MFAVPGWSVSSSALTQQTEASQSKDQSQGKDASTPNAKNNNKRKRGNDRVTSGNVDEMYRRHIEGHSGPKPGKRAGAGAGAGAAAADSSLKPWEKKKLQKEKQASALESTNVTNDAPKTDDAGPGQEDGKPSKKQKRNRKNKDKDNQEDKTQEKDAASPSSAEAFAAMKSLAPPMPAASATLTPLQQAMRQKLISSRFRHLNETLYTTDSSKAVELFNANPELFDEYHAGFARQVKESWPSNPVDGYIQTVRRRGAVPMPRKGQKPAPNKPLPLPRRPNGACTIADLGCGDAGLARALTPSAKKLNLKLNSYDLQAPDALITKADISNLPVEDGSVDVAIFCLSLMGTNWVSFVEEAWRVLRGDGKGECWVSEVKSRFGKVNRKKSQIGAQKPLSKTEQKKQKKKSGKGGDADSDVDEADIFAEDARPADNDETDISAFVEVFKTRGFVLKQESLDKSNKMFVKMEFVKAGWTPTKGKHASAAPAPGVKGGKKRFVEKKTDADTGMSAEQEAQVLKPCVYKIR
ncbi:uncharacterized protein N7498_001839 [Penicillium cinerascens]|uniref:Ribosomal RNA-processing protein 8 n=1 Tax=Penicillium cinerascens TaxID=70096 RepID=A0A9W9TAC0_9EURO|nr:uncharacterized protein N7498_001839 [Penicillium cinerascens]KAJ5215432.1 hypothetical protein N7498_001839 [Penicillium cinerascens]